MTLKHNKSIKLGETLVSACFTSVDMHVHKHHINSGYFLATIAMAINSAYCLYMVGHVLSAHAHNLAEYSAGTCKGRQEVYMCCLLLSTLSISEMQRAGHVLYRVLVDSL